MAHFNVRQSNSPFSYTMASKVADVVRSRLADGYKVRHTHDAEFLGTFTVSGVDFVPAVLILTKDNPSSLTIDTMIVSAARWRHNQEPGMRRIPPELVDRTIDLFNAAVLMYGELLLSAAEAATKAKQSK